MTYIVSGGALNSTHSLTHSLKYFFRNESGSGNRHPIPGHRAPAVAMIGWHVARH